MCLVSVHGMQTFRINKAVKWIKSNASITDWIVSEFIKERYNKIFQENKKQNQILGNTQIKTNINIVLAYACGCVVFCKNIINIYFLVQDLISVYSINNHCSFTLNKWKMLVMHLNAIWGSII